MDQLVDFYARSYFIFEALKTVNLGSLRSLAEWACFQVVFSFLLVIPQLYVVRLDKSSRHCTQPLLAIAIAGIVLTFFTIGFTLLFVILIPVPRAVKIGFHVFGVASFILGLMTIIFTLQAQADCSVSVQELWYLCGVSSLLSLVVIVFLVFIVPFWVVNKAKTNSVMDPYSRTGVCYEPVKCCTCLWHV